MIGYKQMKINVWLPVLASFIVIWCDTSAPLPLLILSLIVNWLTYPLLADCSYLILIPPVFASFYSFYHSFKAVWLKVRLRFMRHNRQKFEIIQREVRLAMQKKKSTRLQMVA